MTFWLKKLSLMALSLVFVALLSSLSSCNHEGLVGPGRNDDDKVVFRVFTPDTILNPDQKILYAYFPAPWFSMKGAPTINVFRVIDGKSHKESVVPTLWDVQNSDAGFENYYRATVYFNANNPDENIFFEVGNDTGHCCQLVRAANCRLDDYHVPFRALGTGGPIIDLIGVKIKRGGIISRVFDPLDSKAPVPYTSMRTVPTVTFLGYQNGQYRYMLDAGPVEFTKEIGLNNAYWELPYDAGIYPGLKREYTTTSALSGNNAKLTIQDKLNNNLIMPVKIP